MYHFYWALFLIFFAFHANLGDENTDGAKYASQISAVLNKLNENPDKIYNYKSATVVGEELKATDIFQLTLEIGVECLDKHPDLPCTERPLNCTSYLRKEGDTYVVLREVFCRPKVEISVEKVDDGSLSPEVIVADGRSKQVDLSHESVPNAASPDSSAIEKEHAPCPGCSFDLNPNADGIKDLIDIALKHVETEKKERQELLRVVHVQQQIVAGSKYFLLIEIAPNVCGEHGGISKACPTDANPETVYCAVEFFEQPWISKQKRIIKNNCTLSQEYSFPE